MSVDIGDYSYSEDVHNAILAYLDHVILKLKKDPDYNPNPIINAILLAINGETLENGTFAGIAGSSEKRTEGEKPDELYMATVEVNNDSLKILDITDLCTGNKLTVYEALLIIELSLKLEKMDKNMISPNEIENLFNEVVKDVLFLVVYPENFKQARDYFKEMLVKKMISIPPDEDLIKALGIITAYTPWEEYNPRVRAFISSIWASRECKFAVSLDSNYIPKHKIIPLFKMCFTGKAKEVILHNIKQKT